jgi:NADPH:quinone reductase-like Zn-dependent oxidoreductase
MRAVVTDKQSPVGVSLGQREVPVPTESQALVRVDTICLNPGELRSRELLATPGWQPGRDFAGIVEQSAADGSGLSVGSRVVGLLPGGGAFAEIVAVPATSLVSLPSTVSFKDAATLPVAGITALFALERCGFLLGRNVLVTGASGGVGQIGIQLARAAGARVTGTIRTQERAGMVEALGADEVLLESSLSEQRSRFDFVLDTVGGHLLPMALASLVAGGTCVAVNHRSMETIDVCKATFDFVDFMKNGLTLKTFYVFDELTHQRGKHALERLVAVVADGRVRPHIGLEASWTDIELIVEKFLNREVLGKIVLHVE